MKVDLLGHARQNSIAFAICTLAHRLREAMKRLLLPMFLIGLANPAFGEGGCPDGQFPRQNGPVMMCVPGGVPGSSSAAPPPVWADQWGAIAADGLGVFGIVSDMASKREAQESAIQECKKRGGGPCRVSIAYYNQCAAVGANSKDSFSYSAPTKEKAEELAVGRCERNR
ncbi:DUF4189 domain-containing protein [Achromobacter xylosoxidans]